MLFVVVKHGSVALFKKRLFPDKTRGVLSFTRLLVYFSLLLSLFVYALVEKYTVSQVAK